MLIKSERLLIIILMAASTVFIGQIKLVRSELVLYEMLNEPYPVLELPNNTLFTTGRDKLFISSYLGRTIWESDGTVAGTRIVWWNNWGNRISKLASANDSIFFFMTGSSIYHLQEDGDSILLKDFNLTTGNLIIFEQVVNIEDTLYFQVTERYQNYPDYDECVNTSIWKSNDLPSQTVLVKSFNQCGLGELLSSNGVLFFITVGEGMQHSVELWRSDGSSSGTYMVKDIAADEHVSSVYNLVDVNGLLYFTSADENGENFLLWRSDGTEDGTSVITSLPEPPYKLTNVNGSLYFITREPFPAPSDNFSLWISDGTQQNTFQIRSFEKAMRGAISVNETLLFVADHELWRSNGTEESTYLIKEFDFIGNAKFVSFAETAYFLANEVEDGHDDYDDLWFSDGSELGTQIAASSEGVFSAANKLTPVFSSSVPGGNLFFEASDSNGEWKLWVLPLPFLNHAFLPLALK